MTPTSDPEVTSAKEPSDPDLPVASSSACPQAHSKPAKDPAADNDNFADTLAMIAELPLTAAEKAEAVRRLLAGGAGEGEP